MYSTSTEAVRWVATITFLSVLVTGEVGVVMKNADNPLFLQPLENHTVPLGRRVVFTCLVRRPHNHTVAWIKSDSKEVLALHTSMVAVNPRLSVTYNGHDTWRLHVTHVQPSDAGKYMCQLNTHPPISQTGQLVVLVPPDIVDETGTGGAVREGGSTRLSCQATGVPAPSVVWRRPHNKTIVIRHQDKEKNVLDTYRGEWLELTGVRRADMGPYYCIASNGVPPAVSREQLLHVHFPPEVRVENQLVGAPLGSRVQLQCRVEASPAPMAQWTKGDAILSNSLVGADDVGSWTVQESRESEYSIWLNLSIARLSPADYGAYVCSAANALGRADTTVTLHMLSVDNSDGVGPVPGAAWRLSPSHAHAHTQLTHIYVALLALTRLLL